MNIFRTIGRAVRNLGEGLIGAPSRFLGGEIEGASDVYKRILDNSIPTLSTRHEVTVNGEIAVNVQGHVSVDVSVDLSDAIDAARLIKEGLENFDLLGGISRQIFNDFRTASALRQYLRDLNETIVHGSGCFLNDDFYFELVFINTSTAVGSPVQGAPSGYFIKEGAACAIDLSLNDDDLLDSYQLHIPKAHTPQRLPPTPVKLQVAAQPLEAGTNKIHFRMKHVDYDNLIYSKVQLRLIQQRRHRRAVIGEWVFDGVSRGEQPWAEPRFDSSFYVFEPPDEVNKSQIPQICSRISSIETQLVVPAVSMPPSIPPSTLEEGPQSASSTFASVFEQRLLRSYEDRMVALDELERELAKLDADPPDHFDARLPFYCVITTDQGNVAIEGVDLLYRQQNGTEVAFPVAAGGYIPRNCEVAFRLPIVVGKNDVKVVLRNVSDQERATVNVSVIAGFDWLNSIVSSWGYVLNPGQVIGSGHDPARVPLRPFYVSDSMIESGATTVVTRPIEYP